MPRTPGIPKHHNFGVPREMVEYLKQLEYALLARDEQIKRLERQISSERSRVNAELKKLRR